MTTNIYFGHQDVATSGYQVVTPDILIGLEQDSRYKSRQQQRIDAGELTPEPSLIQRKGGFLRYYNPLDESALFRVFSDLPPDEKDILSFANKYGTLGPGIGVFATMGNSNELEYVEPLSNWKIYIEGLRRAVNLWDHIQEFDKSWLRKHIHWSRVSGKSGGQETVSIKYDDGSSALIASEHKSVGALRQFAFDDIVKPARLCLQDLINKQTKEHVHSQLLFDSDWDTQASHICAKNLLGYMWLQLACAVEGNLVYRRCVICNKPFQVGAERGKAKKFCSNACRSKDYRAKKKGANHLL